MTRVKLTDRAAIALDMTHDAGKLGSCTEEAHIYLATWLDGQIDRSALKLLASTKQVRRWIEYLEMIARECKRGL